MQNKNSGARQMRYDIIINLDYENFDHGTLRLLFDQLYEAMLEQGFVMDGRRFTIDEPPLVAQQRARDVVSSLEQQYQLQGQSIYPWIKEFFGFEPENASNLLLPPTEEIHVQELEDIAGLEVVNLFNDK
jgi:hypothetical protein